MSEPTNTPQIAPNEPRARTGGHALVDALAQALDRASTGEVAELRRLDPTSPSCPAFWKLAFNYLQPEKRPLSADEESKWAVVISGLARTQGAHKPGRAAGAVLAQVTSEARFTRLLRASGERLWDEIRHVTHQLSTAGESFDWGDFAALILSDGMDSQETTRRKLARDFYGAISRAEAENKKAQETAQ